QRNLPEWARQVRALDEERRPWQSQAFRDQLVGSRERLGWVIPGYLVHRWLPPLPAHLVLHFGFYYAAVAAVFYVLATTIGRHAALLTAVLFGTYFYFLGSISWSYPDGAAATYFALSLAFLSYRGPNRGQACSARPLARDTTTAGLTPALGGLTPALGPAL